VYDSCSPAIDSPEGDPFHQIEKYRARLHLNSLKNYPAFKAIFEEILKTRGSSVETWLELISAER